MGRVIAEVVLVSAAVAGYRAWRAGGDSEESKSVAEERNRFLAFTGMLMSLGVALFVMLASLPAAFVNPCLR